MQSKLRVKFEFFKVEILNEKLNLASMLDDILNGQHGDRNVELNGAICYVDQTFKDKDNASYLFTKSRVSQIPDKTDKNMQRKPIDIDDDEGLCEDVGLSYNKELGVVAIHKNKHSISANGIAKYIKHFYSSVDIVFLPILKKDAYERFTKMNTLRKFRVKISGTADTGSLAKEGSICDALKTLGEMQIPFIDMTLSVGRERKTSIPSLEKTIKNLMGWMNLGSEQENVLELEISGKDEEDGAVTFVDLLEDKLTAYTDVMMNKRRIDITSLLRSSSFVLTNNYEELKNVT